MNFGKVEYTIAMSLLLLFDIMFALVYGRFTFTIAIGIGFLIGLWLGNLMRWVLVK
jgi:hypothetical protein